VNVSITRPKPEMLRPTARVFPFDAVGAEIAEALEARNWTVPGLTVEFDVYGRGDALYRLLKKVSGSDFVLEYGRDQKNLGAFYDIAAVHRIAILKKNLTVFSDQSGPMLEEYVGRAWKSDREKFLDGTLSFYPDKKDRVHEFDASCNCGSAQGIRHTHPGLVSPVLTSKGETDRTYWTHELFDEFAAWLVSNVLEVIKAQPLSEPDYTQFDVADIPYPQNAPELFSFAKFREGVKIRTGQSDPSKLPADQRFALQIGARLVDTGMSDKENPVPDAAYDSFVWCGVGPVTVESTVEGNPIALEVPRDQVFVCRITPNRANDVYVADHAAYMKRREELYNSTSNRDRFTNQEVAEMFLARGRTIVPITEYDGSFAQPIVLIGREVGFDEIEIVSGPHADDRSIEWMKREWEALS
jgi:hypothetical protein